MLTGHRIDGSNLWTQSGRGDDDHDHDDDDNEEMEAVEEVTEYSEHSINREQYHRDPRCIPYILRCDIKVATVSIHSIQFQTTAIGFSIALLILMVMDCGVKEWSGEDISLYTLHALGGK